MKESSSDSVAKLLNASAGLYNDKVALIEDAADITTSVENLNEAVDQYNTLFALSNLYISKQDHKVAVKALEALVPSMEVTIFTIGKALIKALFTICRWVLHTIGKVWKFFFGFFKRSSKDIEKDINLIYNKVPYLAEEAVNPSVSSLEVALWTKIVDAHCEHLDVNHSIPPGTKINTYKTMFYNAFNSSLPDQAKVNATGALTSRPHRNSGASKVGILGWTDGDKLRSGLSDIVESETKCGQAIKAIKAQGGDVAKVAKLCDDYIKNNSATLDNSYIAEKGPQCVDAACKVTVIAKDVINLKRLENDFGRMVEVMRVRAKGYTE